jgi:outer membrane lipoprotein SlyB
MNHKKTISFIAALFISMGAHAGQIDGGAVLGSALGAAAGSAVGSASGGKNGAIIGGGIGGALGAAVGSRDTQERTVYVDQQREYDDHGHRKHHDEGNHYGERKHGNDRD